MFRSSVRKADKHCPAQGGCTNADEHEPARAGAMRRFPFAARRAAVRRRAASLLEARRARLSHTGWWRASLRGGAHARGASWHRMLERQHRFDKPSKEPSGEGARSGEGVSVAIIFGTFNLFAYGWSKLWNDHHHVPSVRRSKACPQTRWPRESMLQQGASSLSRISYVPCSILRCIVDCVSHNQHDSASTGNKTEHDCDVRYSAQTVGSQRIVQRESVGDRESVRA